MKHSDLGRIKSILNEQPSATVDDILAELNEPMSFQSRILIQSERAKLIKTIGFKSFVFNCVRDLNQKHQTNNLLPLHLLRNSLAKTLPGSIPYTREQTDQLLLELADVNKLIELVPLPSDRKYSAEVLNTSIRNKQGRLCYFIRQVVLTSDIIEASSKLDPRILETSSNLDSRVPETSPELDRPNPETFLKNMISKLDLTDPKERASQVAFMLNQDLRIRFEQSCKAYGISIREGLHAALIIFCHNFK